MLFCNKIYRVMELFEGLLSRRSIRKYTGEKFGAVWLGVEPRVERVRDISLILDLPSYIHPVSIISIGVPATSRIVVPERFKEERIRKNNWKD
jgi:hypothetical protein